MKYPNLFKPITIAGVTFPNRIAMAAMSTYLAAPRGAVSKEQVAYYRERALGGTGMVTVEYACVEQRYGLAAIRQLALDSADLVSSHVPLVDAIRTGGGVPLLQLHHSGRQTAPHILKGEQPVAPSAIASTYYGALPRAMETEEVAALVESFARSASFAIGAGYEGIELHGAHGYMLAQFLSPLTNRRDDRWGGDFERRLAFPTAVIKAVKAELGSSRPLIYRISAAEFLDGALTVEDTVKIAPLLVAAGVDCLHVSSGTFDSMEYIVDPMSTEEGWRLAYSRRIRQAVNVPVIGVGPIRHPSVGEKAIADGDVDIVALGRPLLADPEWPLKAKAGEDDDIRMCTSCNWCTGRSGRYLSTACAENPRTGRELDPMIGRFGAGRRAAVVGAGPGGIAAALLLDQAGFEVHLFESRNRLGGGLIASAAPPFKDKFNWYLDYLKRRVDKSRINVKLNTTASIELLRQFDPSVAIIAAGAEPIRLDIDGVDQGQVQQAYDLLMSEDPDALPRGETIVYGGGETGCETAELLAANGANVKLVSRSARDELARSAEAVYRKKLRERLNASDHISIVSHSTIRKVTDTSVVIEDQDRTTLTIPTQAVVLAQGRAPANHLAQQLNEAGIPCALIGDAYRIRRVGDAVHDAYKAVIAFSEQIQPPRLAC